MLTTGSGRCADVRRAAWFIARRWGYPSGRYGSQKFHRRECRLDAESLLEVLIGNAGTR